MADINLGALVAYLKLRDEMSPALEAARRELGVTRLDLRGVPLDDVLPPRPKEVIVTMSVGQWDTFLASAYGQGCVLLELDDDERPVAAYRKES